MSNIPALNIPNLKLSHTVRIILLGGLVSAIGSGATVPYLFVYLNQALSFDTETVGLFLTIRAVGALLGAILGGAWVDRLGPRRAALLALSASAIITVMLLAAGSLVSGLIIMAAYGIVGSALATAIAALLGSVALQEERPKAFSVLYALGNAGAAGGALVAATVLAAWPSRGYAMLYAVDAFSFAVCAFVFWRWIPSKPADNSWHRPRTPVQHNPSYRAVTRDSAMRWLIVITALVWAAGYCQLHVGIPALATNAGLSTSGLGWVFAANLVSVIALQPLVQPLIKSLRRSTLAVSGAIVMAVAWGVVQAVPQMSIVVLALAASIFAAGEVLLAPVLAAVVNDLAPATLRGRYNGAQTLAMTGGWLAGTALTAAVLGVYHPRLLMPILIMLLIAAAFAGMRLRRCLPADTDKPPQLAPREGKDSPCH